MGKKEQMRKVTGQTRTSITHISTTAQCVKSARTKHCTPTHNLHCVKVKCLLTALKIKPVVPVSGFDPQLSPAVSISPASHCLRKADGIKTINKMCTIKHSCSMAVWGETTGGLGFTCTGCWMMTGGGRLRCLSSSARSREFSAASTDSISLLLSSSSSIYKHSMIICQSQSLESFWHFLLIKKIVKNYGERVEQLLGHDAGQIRTQISSMSTTTAKPWLWLLNYNWNWCFLCVIPPKAGVKAHLYVSQLFSSCLNFLYFFPSVLHPIFSPSSQWPAQWIKTNTIHYTSDAC